MNSKYILKIKPIISLTLLILFMLVTITGVGLHSAPTGKYAKVTGWMFLGMNKWTLKDLHTKIGFVVVALVVIHFALNFKMLVAEIKGLRK